MKEIEGFPIQYDFSRFKKIADLIYFQGPFLSHYVSDKGEDYLFYWVDKDDTYNRWIIIRVNLTTLQQYINGKLSLRELIAHPNDGFAYMADVDSQLNYHRVILTQPSSLPDDYLPAKDAYYEFEPIPTEDGIELMTYELTIPYREQRKLENLLARLGFPIASLKKIVSHAAVF